MSVIAIQIESQRATRVFFDCSTTTGDRGDQRRIELAIEHSIASWVQAAESDDAERH
jgi:hypothetical protein